MTLINCLPGVKVKVLSKSIGMSFEGLDYDETEIDHINEEEADIVVDIRGNFFYPYDLEPLWEEGN